MPITYTNRLGKTYYLCVQQQEGQTHYFFSQKAEYERVRAMPKGYRIYEHDDGMVTLRKVRPGEQQPLVRCPHCKQEVKQNRLQAHIKKVHGRAQLHKKGYTEAATGKDMVKCYKCGRFFTKDELGPHIRTAHGRPVRIPREIRAPKNTSAVQQEQQRKQQEAAQRETEATRRRRLAIHIEPFECGWCYQPVYRVLQSNGYNRYYDDRDLVHKHRCMRPVHWRPDK